MEAFDDIERARATHRRLSDFFRTHPGGWADTDALRSVQAMCFEARRAIDDHYCREKIGEVEEYASVLFSARKHQRWSQGEQDGVLVVKRHIIVSLSSFARWLDTIEAARRRRAGG